MRMTGESLAILIIVGGAVLFTARRVWRAVQSARAPRGAAGCDAGCGCETGSPAKERDWAET
jgi:hypothetical protein